MWATLLFVSVWVRRFVAFACLLAAWVVARPAAAAAPMCDERGASVLAPLPILDVPSASLDAGEHSDGCDLSELRDKAYHRGEEPSRVPSFGDAFILTASAPEVMAAAPAAGFPRALPRVACAGVRFLLERPPR